ncbi:MAG: BtaA family protein [Nitrospirota bacterium]|nr:BtaA family protein [Nitrospirota bacterium]
MGQRIQERASFDNVRYSNCWEDADVLLQALDVREGGVYLSISSAGDNTLSILSGNPSLVIALDISAAQLACLELRMAAFASLSYQEVLHFLGVGDGSGRSATYRVIRSALSRDAREFWDSHPEFIERGILHVGKFERYFRLFRRWALPIIHSRDTVLELIREKDAGARADFYRLRWDTWRWRLIFSIFFSRTVMGRLGRDPEFFAYVEGNVAERIRERAGYALTALPTHDNPYLEYILKGNFENSLPFYLRQENFEAIKRNLCRLILFKGSVDEALQANKGVLFDGFNLSDIFEYMSYEEYVSALERIAASSKMGARLVYWNMLADRKPPDLFKERLAPLGEIAGALFLKDKAFFYKALRVEQVR